MRTTLRMHPMMDKFILDHDVQATIEQLLHGGSVESIPPKICHQVITGLTARRKNAILHNQDALANKIDVILGEIQRGPQKFEIDTPYDPTKTCMSRTFPGNSDSSTKLETTTTKLISGEQTLDQIDSKTRQEIGPILKRDRILELSRSNYSQTKNIDTEITRRQQYAIDSRRVAPKLIQRAQLEKKLAAARAHYEQVRMDCYQRRKEYSKIEDAARYQLETKLSDQMVENGTHIPTSLPLEYQKFSWRVLNAREKEHKASQLGLYDDAIAQRKKAAALEKQELERNNANFTHAFKANRDYLMKAQDRQREGFNEVWRRKKDKVTADLSAEMEQARKAVENLERQLAFTKSCEAREIARISQSQQMIRPARSIPASHNSFK